MRTETQPLDRRRNSTLRFKSFLNQQGPFALNEDYSPGNSTEGFDTRSHLLGWLRGLEPGDRAEYRAARTELFLTLGVNSFEEIAELRKDLKKKKAASDRVYQMIGKTYGIEGPLDTVKALVNNYATTADTVVTRLQTGVLSQGDRGSELTNEIRHTTNPVDLIIDIFDPKKNTKKVRFEAKRKLFLMELAAGVDREERIHHPRDKQREFDTFLDDYVWKKDDKTGKINTGYLYSKHNPATNECESVEVISFSDGYKKRPDLRRDRELLTLIGRRTFEYGNREIPVYITTRPKDPVAKILKMLRKDTDSSKVAVEDDLGAMMVFDNEKDMNAFVSKLQQAMATAGFLPRLSDFSDTLTGGIYEGNKGSSPETQMRKTYIEFPDKKIEIQLHTNNTYLDYYNKNGVRHDEYVAKRLYKSGVVELMFPEDIYHLDFDEAEANKITEIRQHIKSPQQA